jgi:hypothetical protein
LPWTKLNQRTPDIKGLGTEGTPLKKEKRGGGKKGSPEPRTVPNL